MSVGINVVRVGHSTKNTYIKAPATATPTTTATTTAKAFPMATKQDVIMMWLF